MLLYHMYIFRQFKKRRFEDRNKDRSLNRQNRNNRKRKPRNAFQKAPEIDLAQDSDSEDEGESPTKLPKFRGMKMGLEDLLVNSDVKIEDTANVKVEGEIFIYFLKFLLFLLNNFFLSEIRCNFSKIFHCHY